MAYGFNDDKSKEIIVPEKSLILERYETSSSDLGLMFPNSGVGNNYRTFACVSINKLKEFLVKNNVPSFSSSNTSETDVMLSIFMNSTPYTGSRKPLTCTRCRAPFEWDASNRTFNAYYSAYLEFEVIEIMPGIVIHDHYTGRVVTRLDILPDTVAFGIDSTSMNNSGIDSTSMNNRWTLNAVTNAFINGSTVNNCFCQIAKLEIVKNYLRS